MVMVMLVMTMSSVRRIFWHIMTLPVPTPKSKGVARLPITKARGEEGTNNKGMGRQRHQYQRHGVTKAPITKVGGNKDTNNKGRG